MEQIQRQHPQDRRERQDAKNPYVGEQPYPNPAERERPYLIPPKSAVDQIQAYHEHAQERQILAVHKRMGVQARMQQEDEHGEQRQEAAAEHAVGQQPAEKAARQKEGVGKRVSSEIDRAGIFLAQDALDNRQRDLEGDAVVYLVRRVRFSLNMI